MATESPIRMLENDGSKSWQSIVDPALFASPFNNITDKVLNQNGKLGEQTRVVPNRSGSAPPTVEGSIAVLRALMDQKNSILANGDGEFLDSESEEQMRTDPGYIAYYYANVNLNPRLPPPLLSRENRHMVRLMGGLGSKRLISVTEGVSSSHREEVRPEEDTSSHDPEQGDLLQAPSPASCTAVKGENDHDIRTVLTDQVQETQEPCSVSVNVHGSTHTVTNHVIPSTDFPPTTSSSHKNADTEDNTSTESNDGSDISVVESRMRSLNVSGSLVSEDDLKRHQNIHSTHSHDKDRISCHPLQPTTYQVLGFQGHAIPQGMQPLMHNPGLIPPLHATTAAYMNSGNLFYPSLRPLGFLNPQPLSGFHPPYLGGYIRDSAFAVPISAFFKQPLEATGGMIMNPYTGQTMPRPSFIGPIQGQLQRGPDTSLLANQELGPLSIGNLSISTPTNGTHIGYNYYGRPPTVGMPHYPPPSSVVAPESPLVKNEYPGPGNALGDSQHYPNNAVACSGGKVQRGSNSSDDSTRRSFLDLLKSCNSRKLELSDISGQIVEFSTDQHGSRFIQQKLENCGSDEKESVFNEVLPHASKLMIDVFGNYVIQKFFEHGTAEHRRKLGDQLSGQILTLSLQMYGCRVIQKALEVIELDQKVELVQELDGHVMRCVHDQNGNHVIQKCIESVPTEKIGFIISSFYSKVASLSSHPYGCRVIQRVLEHCLDEKINRRIVDELLEAACNLAQDPYGNYVTQHVLEMGKPQERSKIIHKLTGNFVQMSQHKYASNVVEKCLKYGNATEQDLIIEEVVSQSDKDGLLKMMKDQFANYVVQKIFDIGSDKQKEILLDCIRVHLPTLKRFPYAKHIVARYEQLSEGSSLEQK